MPGDRLIDQLMPRWDFQERHQALAAAPPEACHEAMWRADLGGSPVVQALIWLRGLAPRLSGRGGEAFVGRTDLSMTAALANGFVLLDDQPPRQFVLGLAGRFWTPSGGLKNLTPEQWRAFDQPGAAKVASDCVVEPVGPGLCRLSTETRVLCHGPRARAAMRRYWLLIRIGSGLIRREWLRLARARAEASARPLNHV